MRPRRSAVADWRTAVLLPLFGCSSDAEPVVAEAAGTPVHFPDLVDMAFVPRVSAAAGAIGDLLIDRFEVTDGEYAVFLAATGQTPVVELREGRSGGAGDRAARGEHLAHWSAAGSEYRPEEADTPVRYVGLAEAEAYAAWRGKQIPTREEWLAGCKSLAEGRLPWQPRAFTGVCNSLASGLSAPMPVGSYELGRSPSGCYDMVGNVAEWTVSTSLGPEKRQTLGGSFERHCLPPEGDPARTGVSVSTRPEHGEDRLAPWLDTLAPELRRGDVGFRCVIRDASERLEAAFVAVERLSGLGRAAAIDELVAVGEWVLEENRLLSRVQMRALKRRVRYRVRLAGDGVAFRGEVFVAPDAATLVVAEPGRMRLLDGRDGSLKREIPLPFAGEAARRPWLGGTAEGALTHVVGPAGEIALVSLDDGRVRLAPAPRDAPELDVPTTRVAAASSGDAPADDATWFVQRYVVESGLEGAAERSLRPRTRIIRFDATGVRERTLDVELFTTPPPAGGDGLLLLGFEERLFDLPVGDRGGVRSERTLFAWLSAELFGPDLVTRDRAVLATDLEPAPGAVRRVWRFATQGGASSAGVVTLTSDADAFPRPLRLPCSYVLADSGGAPWLVGVAASRIAAPRRLEGLPAPGFTIGPSAAADVVAPPFAVGGDGAELRRVEPGGRTTPVAEGLLLGEAPTVALEADDGDALLLGTRSGRFAGVDLRRRRAASLFGATGPMIDVALFRTADAAIAVSQPSAWAARWWSLADGSLLDSVRLELDHPPIRSLLVVDADRDGKGEPWLLLADGQLLALGAPEPGSQALVEDFESAVRRREALRDPGRE
jgi:hypothetical protein